jgi:hypothetical protein
MASRQRIGLLLMMSMSLLTMTISILKTISLSHIVAQQSDPTATDVQYGASLTILWSCLEQAFVIIMGCVPPLRSISRLPVAQTISSSLSSILRTKKSSKSMESSRYGSSEGPFEELGTWENHRDHTGKTVGPVYTVAASYREARADSHPNLGANNIRSTTDTSVSYSRDSDDA